MDYNHSNSQDPHGLSSKFDQLRLKKVDSQVIFVDSRLHRLEGKSNGPTPNRNQGMKIFPLDAQSKSYRED